jgi:uncharacterized protein (DUF1778 family)
MQPLGKGQLAAAFDTLADFRVFQLDEVQWAAFMAALEYAT